MLYSSAKPQYMCSKVNHLGHYKTAWNPPVLPLCALQGARTLVNTGMPKEKGTSMAIRGAESPSDNPKYCMSIRRSLRQFHAQTFKWRVWWCFNTSTIEHMTITAVFRKASAMSFRGDELPKVWCPTYDYQVTDQTAHRPFSFCCVD